MVASLGLGTELTEGRQERRASSEALNSITYSCLDFRSVWLFWKNFHTREGSVCIRLGTCRAFKNIILTQSIS